MYEIVELTSTNSLDKPPSSKNEIVVSFNWILGGFTKKIAVLSISPIEKIDELKFSVISGNEQTPYSLNYNNIFVYSLAALKELDSQVQTINENLNKNENFIKNEGSNDLATIVNSKIEYIGQLVKKIEHLESRLANIEKAF